MDRRKFLAGLGATATGGVAAMGTGAFTSVDADRTVSVAVADESTSSYLVLSPLGEGPSENGAFSSSGGGTNAIQIDFNSNIGNTVNSEGGDGVGKDSTYQFDEVFEVENQGTQTVSVGIETLTQGDFEKNNGNALSDTLTVSFYPDSHSGQPLQGNFVSLSPGNTQTVGMKIETGNLVTQDFDAEATVIADADSGQISF